MKNKTYRTRLGHVVKHPRHGDVLVYDLLFGDDGFVRCYFGITSFYQMVTLTPNVDPFVREWDRDSFPKSHWKSVYMQRKKDLLDRINDRRD